MNMLDRVQCEVVSFCCRDRTSNAGGAVQTVGGSSVFSSWHTLLSLAMSTVEHQWQLANRKCCRPVMIAKVVCSIPSRAVGC